jgi:hypothetical protein
MEIKPRPPRICLISQRAIRKHAAWCSMYEFEDVISQVDDVERLDLRRGQGFAWRNRAVGSLVWRRIPYSTSLNPGFCPIKIESEYDLFVFPCINPFDLLYLNAIRGWKEKCRKKVCYMYEEWAGDVPGHRHLLSLLDGFDHVIFGWKSSAQAVQKVVNIPCSHLSPAADTLRFSPYPNPPQRSIDIYSLGRRVEALHTQLLETARTRELFYVYDTLPGECLQPSNHVQHRELFANLAKRTRFFLTYPAKVDRFEETRGLSEAGTRFYEAVAAGAVMVGRAPDSDAFKAEFNWTDSVINIGEHADELVSLMREFERHPGRFEQLCRTNSVEALKRHDWVYRWDDILRIVGESPTEKLALRKDRLSQLAQSALANP